MTEQNQQPQQTEPRSKFKIISDGTAQGTMIFLNNQPVNGVYKLEIEPLLPNQPVRATIGILVDQLHIDDPEVKIEPKVIQPPNVQPHDVAEGMTNGASQPQ